MNKLKFHSDEKREETKEWFIKHINSRWNPEIIVTTYTFEPKMRSISCTLLRKDDDERVRNFTDDDFVYLVCLDKMCDSVEYSTIEEYGSMVEDFLKGTIGKHSEKLLNLCIPDGTMIGNPFVSTSGYSCYVLAEDQNYHPDFMPIIKRYHEEIKSLLIEEICGYFEGVEND